MTIHFATHFNSGYVFQGLALYFSINRNVENFILWIICLDDEVYQIFESVNLPNIKLVKKNQWETEELKEVKKTRSLREYCWTITPSVPNIVFEFDSSINQVTYIDADMWLRKDPEPIFKELQKANKHVLITEHHYAPKFDETYRSGKYCVQFLIFNRDKSEALRKDWESKCRDWCYAYHDNGRFGDQKYLEDWPKSYRGIVHNLKIKDAILASWNATRFDYFNCIAWHFHGIEIFKDNNNSVYLNCSYQPIPDEAIDKIYKNYANDIKEALNIIGKEYLNIIPKKNRSIIKDIKSFLKKIYYRIFYGMSCEKILKIKSN